MEQAAEAEAGADEDDGGPDVFRVWPENWDSVQVFLLCAGSCEIVAGMSGIFYLGIKLSEIETAMRMMKIPFMKRLGIARDVAYMASIAAEVKNRD